MYLYVVGSDWLEVVLSTWPRGKKRVTDTDNGT